jgi:topoisomerase-4 subunit A
VATWGCPLKPSTKAETFKHLLLSPVTREDLIMLTEIKIKRISRYDANRATEQIRAIEDELKTLFTISSIYTITQSTGSEN